MKRILALYQPLPGGATLATKKLLKAVKAHSDQKIKVVEIPLLNNLSWGSEHKSRLQLVRYYWQLYKLVTEAVQKTPSQILYTPSSLLLFFAWFTQRQKLNYYYHYHGEFYQNWRQLAATLTPWWKKYLYGWPVYWFLAQSEKRAIVVAKKIFAPSQFSAQQLQHFFGRRIKNKIVVVPYGLDHKTFRYQPRTYKRTQTLHVVYAGRVDPNKGVMELLEALEIVNTKHRVRFSAALLSNYLPVYEAKVKRKLKRLPLPQRVIWNAKPAQLARLYRSADVGVLASAFEQLPLSFLEAAACGCPMITTPVGALREYQRRINPSLLLKSRKPESIAQALLTVAKWKASERKSTVAACLEVTHDLSWTRAATTMTDVWKRYES